MDLLTHKPHGCQLHNSIFEAPISNTHLLTQYFSGVHSWGICGHVMRLLLASPARQHWQKHLHLIAQHGQQALGLLRCRRSGRRGLRLGPFGDLQEGHGRRGARAARVLLILQDLRCGAVLGRALPPSARRRVRSVLIT